MGQPRRITDSFPRRRRAGRPPGKVKGKSKVKGRIKRKGTICLESCPPAPTEDPPAPPGAPAQAVLDMLRHFDLSWEYGPCAGITRLQRWERAQALGLSPPGPVLDVILEHPNNPAVTYSLWHEYEL